MDSEKDGQLWRLKWHILVICTSLAGVVVLALFTKVFEKAEAVRDLVFLLGSLVFLGALLAMLSRVSHIVNALRDNSTTMEEATKALENIRAGLAQINQSTRISEAVKAIAFRDEDRQSLREAVFDKLKESLTSRFVVIGAVAINIPFLEDNLKFKC